MVKASDEDIGLALRPQHCARRCFRHLGGYGPALVVIASGAEGAIARSTGSQRILAATPMKADVADIVGAGDSLMAGLLAGLLE